ncbi:MAG: 4-aminobutyrate--2-oxoglutarate transaminase [bacterium]
MKSAELLGLRLEHVPRGPANYFPVWADHAKNAIIVDVDGNRYIDFAGGIGVMNVGHCHPKVVAAVRAQSERFSHTCFHVAMYEPYVRLAQKLNEVVPGDCPKKTMFVNSGAEAVENAVKIARYFTQRNAIVVFEGAFHGRTLLAMSLTSRVRPFKKGFGPFAPEIYRIPYAYCYRCPISLSYPACRVECSDLLSQAFENHVDAETVAAVLVEPIQGEGGFIVPPPEYLQKLKAICESHNILLICDEIQTGFGRTGSWFACEHSQVAPDLVLTAKSLGSGYPIAGITGRAEVIDAPPPGGLGGTYGGNPVACAAGLAVFEIIEEEGLLKRAESIGQRAFKRLAAMQSEFQVVGDVRGKGAMVAMELVEDRGTKEPASALAKELRTKLYENGMLCLLAGMHDNVVRLLAPLTIEDEVLEEGLNIMRQSLETVVAGTEATPGRRS